MFRLDMFVAVCVWLGFQRAIVSNEFFDLHGVGLPYSAQTLAKTCKVTELANKSAWDNKLQNLRIYVSAKTKLAKRDITVGLAIILNGDHPQRRLISTAIILNGN